MWGSLYNWFTSKRSKSIVSKETYNYLVVAALQEELKEFCNLCGKKQGVKHKTGGAVEIVFKKGKKQIKILTYSSNKMGMTYNAAAIMNVIAIHQPVYTFFIGTCAGLIPEKQKTGDILVPHFVFAYESGKHSAKGVFEADHISFDTSEDIRKYSENLKSNIRRYNVTTDENFCSGAAIIDNKVKKEEIKNDVARKVTGLDMEAFAIGCINDILKKDGKQLAVIKGIMDFGENKLESENNNNKTLAKKNSADFTLKLIRYIDENVMGFKQDVTIRK